MSCCTVTLILNTLDVTSLIDSTNSIMYTKYVNKHETNDTKDTLTYRK